MSEVAEVRRPEEGDAPEPEQPTPEPTEEPAEPSEPAQEPTEPSEPVPPHVPEGMSEKQLNEVRNKLERSANNWRGRAQELLGDEFEYLTPCELCDPIIPGFHFPADVENPRDPVHAALLEVLKTPGEPEYLEDPNTRQCGVCGGLGKTRTKGKVPGKTTRVCTACKGIGFLSSEIPAAPPTNGTVAESEFELPSNEPLVTEDADVWGSPRVLDDGMENPNYGKMPQYKDPSLP